PEIGFRLTDRLDVSLGSDTVGAVRAPIELPRRNDHLPLSVDEFVDRTRIAGSGHRLALRQRKLLLERPDVEEEDVATCLVGLLSASEIPRPNVVRDEVSRLNVEVFQRERVSGRSGCRMARYIQRDHPFIAAPYRIHEIQPFYPIVVVRLSLDVH